MAANVGVVVELEDSQAKSKLESINKLIKALTARKYSLQVDAAGTDIAAKNIAQLTSSAAKFDAQIKASEAAAKRFSAAIQAQMLAEQEAAKAQDGLLSSYNDYDKAIKQRESEGKAFANQLKQQMLAEQEAARAAKELGDAEQKAAGDTHELGSAAEQAGSSAEQAANGWSVMGAAIASALGHLASRAIHAAISKITQGIREALTEMKEVDTQLTNISKVSGITGQALADMGERAYETASKYGVAADEYLSAVYTFQKAGLNDSAEQMGELAVKTMLVGDTTADVASQFLISANAAWKLGGNMERLNQIVDEADYINNNYATDLGKLSSGLPRVASIAAQAGMSAEETLAALGTITAVTQESGTKAATALRALILNIEGQIGEFVDDTGETFTVTAESVKSMEGLMSKYAKAELDAAKASGELINPLTAIRAIFEGMANSDLNDQELFTLLSGMGGKLRTNQLTALVQNYQLFDEMLNKIADSAGTADGEIALMMESWERKTQVLKNTWTEFIADVVSTDAMKGAIEGLTEIVRAMDSLVERGDNPWYDSDQTNKEIESTEQKIKDLQSAIDSLKLESDKESLLNLHDLEQELALQQEILETKKAQYALEHAEEAKKLQKELTRDYLDSSGTWNRVDIEELNTLGRRLGNVAFEGNLSEYQANLKSVISDFSDYYDKVMQVKDAGEILTAEQEQFVKNYETANNLAETQGLHLGEIVDGYQQIIDSSGNVVAAVKDITPELQKQREGYQQQLDDLDAIEEYTQSLLEANGAIPEDMSVYEQSLARARGETENLSNEESTAATAAQAIASAVGNIDLDSAVGGAENLARALEAAAQAAAGIAVGPIGFASGTSSAPGGPALVNELGPELISENGRAYIANGGRPAVVNLSPGAIVLPANVTKNALKGNGIGGTINAYAVGEGHTDYGTGLIVYDQTEGSHGHPHTREQYIEEGTVTAYSGDKYWQCPKCGTLNKKGTRKCSKCGYVQSTAQSGSGKGKGGGGQSKKEKAQTAADKLSKKLSNIDKRAQLAHTEERYDDEQALYDKAIKLIDAQIKRYKAAGYKSTSDEIVDLKNKRYSYKDKRESVEKDKWNAEIERRQKEHDAQKQEDEMAKRQQALADAQTALENAQKQRNVRIYNSETGQWEWVADQKAIQSAQDKLTSAQEAYDEAIYDQEINDLKSRRDAGEKYGGTKAPTLAKAVQDFTSSLGAVYGGATYGQFSAVKNGASGGDSHDTIYNFGNITMSEAEAQATSVAELAKRLNVLKIS